ncbi:MAG: hypothetical protein EHM58_05330 [Ignavibacteriae bacterium]|nr:MAG: hypothetical protein EHM58_05330 [Ignavibacteriota bacterium]
MKKILLFVFLFFVSLPVLYSQNLNLRFSTNVYGWERADSLADSAGNAGPKTFHMKAYQNLLFEVQQKQWSFNTSLQAEEDVMNKTSEDAFKYRAYNLYIKGTNLFNVLDVKAGRQYVYAGVGKGPIDGLLLKIKAGKNKEFQLTGFGGALTPYDYTFTSHFKAKENYMVGAQFAYYGVKDLMASLSYTNKHRKLASYYTLRPDSLFNLQEVLIDYDTPAEQLAGLDFNYTYLGKHNFYGNAYYDINLKKFYYGEFNVRTNVMKNLNLSAGYTYRQPQLAYNTIFWVFTHKQNMEIEGGADYTFNNGMNAFVRVSDVIYDDDNSIRVQAGVSHANFGINFTRYMGYSGESDGINAYYTNQIVPEKLSGNAAISYARYELGDYFVDKVNSLSGMIGITYRPIRQFTIDLQGQFIKNRIYKTDTRFMAGFSYWLFKKF